MKTVTFFLKASIAGILVALIVVLLLTYQNQTDIAQTETNNTVIENDLADTELPPTPISQPSSQSPFSYADAVQHASPSVVNIYTRKTVKLQNNTRTSSLMERFFGIPQQPRSRVETGLGSGVIFSQQGHIVTNFHVVEGAEDIHVSLQDGRDLPAKFIGADPETDLAILKINAEQLDRIILGESDSLRVGDVVLAIGNPFGVGQTVTMGIVSATGRDRLGLSTFENFIQTDAAINPGNSGGALVNARGELIGINTAIFSQSGSSHGIGFAIPANMVRDVLSQIIQYGSVIRGWLGIEARDIPPNLQQKLGVQGIVIIGVLSNGPADKANLKYGDIITEINNKPITSTRNLVEIITNNKPGTELNIRIRRDNEYINTLAVLAQRPKSQS